MSPELPEFEDQPEVGHPATEPEADALMKHALEHESPSEMFEDYPNRREALRAKDESGATVFATHAIAKKLYRCPCCQGDIQIGSSHTIISRVQHSKRYNHHHLHNPCFHDEILSSWKHIKTIEPRAASAPEVNKRSRRHRYRQR